MSGRDLYHELDIDHTGPQLLQLILEIIQFYPVDSFGALEILSQLASFPKMKTLFEVKTIDILEQYFSLLSKKDISIDSEFTTFASQILTQILQVMNKEITKSYILKLVFKFQETDMHVRKASVVFLNAFVQTAILDEEVLESTLESYASCILNDNEPILIKVACFDFLDSLVTSKNVVGEKSRAKILNLIKKTIPMEGLVGASANTLLVRLIKDCDWISKEEMIDLFSIVINKCFLNVIDYRSSYFDAVTRSIQIILSKSENSCLELISTFSKTYQKGIPKDGRMQILVLISIAGTKIEKSSDLSAVLTVFIDALDETSNDMFFDAAIKMSNKLDQNEKHFEKLYPILLSAVAAKRAVPLGLFKYCLESRKCQVAKKHYNHIMDCFIGLLESKHYPIHLRSVLLDTVSKMFDLDHKKFEFYSKQMNDVLSKMTRLIEQEVIPNLFGSMIEFTKLIVKQKYDLVGYMPLIVIWTEIASLDSELDQRLHQILTELIVSILEVHGVENLKKMLKPGEEKTIKEYLQKFGDEKIYQYTNML